MKGYYGSFWAEGEERGRKMALREGADFGPTKHSEGYWQENRSMRVYRIVNCYWWVETQPTGGGGRESSLLFEFGSVGLE